ncbi:MAG: YiiD C-terminal domain-containing protein, partial [Pseudomonadota bacterium]
MSTTTVAKPERHWLEQTLTRQIPLGHAMQLTLARLDEVGIALAAPLAPNVNDKGTAFGGALMSMMTLAGWSLPRLVLRRQDLKAELVIGRCEVRFLTPVSDDFQALCSWPEADLIQAFIERLIETGKGKLELNPRIEINGQVAAQLQARYV